MKITQIRNATLQITYAGQRFLIDPMLSPRHSWPGFEGTLNSHERNPLVHLPLPLDEIIDVDAVIVTHLHEDHWDAAAQKALPKTLPILAQNAADAEIIRSQGFENVQILSEAGEFGGVSLVQTAGRHGTDAAYEMIAAVLGKVSGVVFKHPSEKTLYVAGDTIWNADVAAALALHQPEISVLNAGYARVLGLDDGIIMGTADVKKVHDAAPDMVLIASHMEAVNHCALTRADLRSFAKAQGFGATLLTPADGETLEF